MKIKFSLNAILDGVFTAALLLLPLILIALVWFQDRLSVQILLSDLILIASSFLFHKLFTHDSRASS